MKLKKKKEKKKGKIFVVKILKILKKFVNALLFVCSFAFINKLPE